VNTPLTSKPKGREVQNRCFLSHSTEHEDHAAFLKHEIENACAVEVFAASDPSSLTPGDEWYTKVLTTLKQSKVTLLLLSHSSINRPWLLFESGGAKALGHKLIPLLFGGLPPTLLPGPLAPLQSCDLSNRHGVIAMLKQLPSAQIPHMTSLSKGARSIVEYFRDVKGQYAETIATDRPLPSLQYRLALLGTLSETQRRLFFHVRTCEFRGKKKKKGVLESDIRKEVCVPYWHDIRKGFRIAHEHRGSARGTRHLVISTSEYYFRLRELCHLGLLEMEKVSEFENRWSLNSEIRQILR
jgi:TIR domain